MAGPSATSNTSVSVSLTLLRSRIVWDVLTERDYQEKDWGPEHDDKLQSSAWAALIGDRVLRFAKDSIPPADYRRALVEISALAIAALESFDRASGL